MNKLDWSKNLRGVYKKWIWGDTYNYSRICDYIQKINYCIQDLNNEIEALAEPTMKEVVYVIVLVDWICEAILLYRTISRYSSDHKNGRLPK